MRILILAMSLLVALTLWLTAGQWTKLDWNIGFHGWLALTLAVVLSFGVGGGLMALSFYSSRHGYDDRVQPFDPEDHAESDEDR